MVTKLLKSIVKIIDKARTKNAIKKANRLFNRTGMKFLVLWYKGKPLVKSKQELKRLVSKGYFQKGITIQKIEAMSIYQTR